MKNDPVLNYILKSERNLGIAAAVGEAWPEARTTVVEGFIDRLERRLKRNLRGWKFEPYNRHFIDMDSNCSLWKPAWEDQYYITLHWGNRGQKMVFGVLRAEEDIGKRKFCPELLAAIKKRYPSARSRTWWEAVIDMHSPTSDWRKPEVLWRMHKDEAFLAEVAEKLLEIVELSEHIVDRLARKHRK